MPFFLVSPLKTIISNYFFILLLLKFESNFMHDISIPDLINNFICFMDFTVGMNGFRRIVCSNSTIQMSKNKRNWPNNIVQKIRKVCSHLILSVYIRDQFVIIKYT